MDTEPLTRTAIRVDGQSNILEETVNNSLDQSALYKTVNTIYSVVSNDFLFVRFREKSLYEF